MGIQINGQTDTITSSDGSFTLSGNVGIPSTTELNAAGVTASGLNVTGVVTATTFEGNLTGNVTGDVAGSFSGSGVNITGVITATSYQGDGSALTGIDATSLKDSGGNVKVQAESSGVVVTGVLTASSSIVVGETFLKEHSVGIGTTTTAGRNAGVGTALGEMIYNVTTGAVEVYGEDGWASIGSLSETSEYFVFTSPGTANITSNNEFGPTATVDILHISPGSSGSTGQGGCGSSNACGAGGAGGAGGVLHYKVGLTVAQTGTSIPVTIPSYPTPVMPSPSPGGGPFAGGAAPPGPGDPGNPGNAGTPATFTIVPFAPYFPAYTLTNGSGGAATPAGTDSYAGDGGSGGGGGLVVTQNGTVPTTLAPPTNSSITGTNGNAASGFGGRQPGPGGNGGTGYGAGGGGGAGGAELNGSTTGGGAGGAGAPGIMIIRVTGFV